MTEKVFAVCQGSYSDYHIVKICKTEERAIQFMEDDIKEEWNKYYAKSADEYKDKLKECRHISEDDWDYSWNLMHSSFEEYRKAVLPDGNDMDHYSIEEYDVLE